MDALSRRAGYTRDAVAADPASTRWGTRLFVLDDPPALVGWGGFKGPPKDGEVEIGYAVAPSFEGRGSRPQPSGELARGVRGSPRCMR